MREITIAPTHSQFVRDICDVFTEQIQRFISDSDRCNVLLSGGNTPIDIFRLLSVKYRERVNWSQVYFFWIDERCVGPNHIDSNYRSANEHLLKHLPTVGGIYRMKGELDPQAAAKEYKNTLHQYFNGADILFDIALIGMGEDGHVASIFPNSDESIALDELVLATKDRYGGYHRVTLGLNLINRTKYKILIARGNHKYSIIKNSGNLPVQYVQYNQIIIELDHDK